MQMITQKNATIPKTLRDALGPAHKMAQHFIDTYGIERFAGLATRWGRPSFEVRPEMVAVVRPAAEAFKAQHRRYPFGLEQFGISNPRPEPQPEPPPEPR